MLSNLPNTFRTASLELTTNSIGGLPITISESIGIMLVLWGATAFFRYGYYSEDTGNYEDIGQIILTLGWLLYVLENTAAVSEAIFWEQVALYTFFYLLATVIGVKSCVFAGEFTRAIVNGDLSRNPKPSKPAYDYLDTVTPSKRERPSRFSRFTSFIASKKKTSTNTSEEKESERTSEFNRDLNTEEFDSWMDS